METELTKIVSSACEKCTNHRNNRPLFPQMAFAIPIPYVYTMLNLLNKGKCNAGYGEKEEQQVIVNPKTGYFFSIIPLTLLALIITLMMLRRKNYFNKI